MGRKFSKKNQKGQFFTKNSDYIFQGLEKYIHGKDVIDPFAGDQDLMNWAVKNGAKKVIGYEIDKKLVDNKKIFYNDTLNNVKSYKFVITNPPYLHKNKASTLTKKKYFKNENKKFDDLYQISIKSIMDCEEGIIIVPLNFLSADNSRRIREIFFEKFEIKKINIFYERVFADTTYNVIAFYFKRKSRSSTINKLDATIYPEGKKVHILIEKEYGWKMGGKITNFIDKIKNTLGVYRLTEDMLAKGPTKIKLAHNHIDDVRDYMVSDEFKKQMNHNIILLRAIDNKDKKKIQLEDIRNYGVKGLLGKNTSRNMAHIIFGSGVSVKAQEQIIIEFNRELNNARDQHLSFFLTNYRDNNRKRISFYFTYKLINYVYNQRVAVGR